MSPYILIPPAPSEYAPYYRPYVDQVPDGDILSILAHQQEEVLALIEGISEARAEHRYAPGKWSLREVLVHVTDAERIFAYRALCFSRGEAAPLPGFEQDAYVAHANAAGRPLSSLAQEFRHLRASNIALFESFDHQMLMRRGVASGFEFSVRAIPYIMAGHVRHHLRILEERYLS